MYNSENKEVRFDKYCQTCRYWRDGKEIQWCDECLEESMRCGTEVPLKYTKDE
jgi:hypothetical protein